jgi:hypothetical protein
MFGTWKNGVCSLFMLAALTVASQAMAQTVGLNAAILPSSRAVTTNEEATFFP